MREPGELKVISGRRWAQVGGVARHLHARPGMRTAWVLAFLLQAAAVWSKPWQAGLGTASETHARAGPPSSTELWP
jgi:hypothetical protein